MVDSGRIIKTFVISVLVCILLFLIYQTSSYYPRNSISEYYVLNKDSVEYKGSNKQNTEEELWVPDWYNHTDVGGVLRRRLQTVREKCTKYTGYRNQWKDKPRIKQANSGSIKYCYTAKAGSTFWNNLLQAVRKTSKTPAANRTVKLTTVRNPWHRLVSTYIHKFSTKWRSHAQNMCHKDSLKDRLSESL
ncbi:hypothetical protein EB796_022079 [Bugula neritina]|uniref:Uncharacterized protein n=1 Tax=Bugula neritina TaxID=10212 RepID=A0A7J7J1J5_BUGNE|nr:hypothetical protein EB796_022079 [Bugula neritina]